MDNNKNSNTLAEELQWRGFVNQTTFKELEEVNQPRSFYWGVDPSADSMTIGNLSNAMMIRHFVSYGHTPILLVGGATGMIGDPDGKKQERDLKSFEEIKKNKTALSKQYERVFSDTTFEIVDNYEWFKNISFLSFLRDIGKHMSMTQLLDRDFIQSRIGEGGDGISFAEFSYSLIQGYDFLHLYRNNKVTLQISGADQWGNCLSGVELIRKLDGGEAHVFTMPLVINKATGEKFGKSENGAIWLDPEKTSPFKFYQFWLNVDDESAKDLIKIYTLLSQSAIEQIIDQHVIRPSDRTLQKTIAREVTDLVHGNPRRLSIERCVNALFNGSIDNLSDNELDELAVEIPVSQIGSGVVQALVSSKIASGNGDARRLIEQGAISINGEKITTDQSITEPSLIKKGKNSFVLIK